MRAPLRALTFAALAGGAALGYGSVLERNWFALRRFEVPVSYTHLRAHET